MPDHLHALLSFAPDQSMSEVIRDWKRFHARTNQVIWQKDISIIDCDLTNAARSSRQK
jgi:REP element-mobilizing transposase RayT